MYLVQEEDLLTAKVEFADGIEPVLISKTVKPIEDLRSDLTNKKKTVKTKKSKNKETEKAVEEVKEEKKAKQEPPQEKTDAITEAELEPPAKILQQEAKGTEPADNLSPLTEDGVHKISTKLSDAEDDTETDIEAESTEDTAEKAPEEIVPVEADEEEDFPEIVSPFDDNSEITQSAELSESSTEEIEISAAPVAIPAGFSDEDVVNNFAMGLLKQNLSEKTSS